MLKRVLVTFENLNEVEQLLNYSQILQNDFGAEVVGIYIKDIRKYEVVPPMAEGIIIDSTNGFAMREWELIEEKRAEEIKALFREKIPYGPFIIEEGIGLERVIERMKAFDLLLVAKGEYINSNLKTILKFHAKPVIIVPNTKVTDLDKVILLDDNGIRANAALFNFLNLFSKFEKIDSLSFGKEEPLDEMVSEYYKLKNIEIERHFEDTIEKIKNYEKDYNLFVMGNLKYNFLLERLTGKFGVKILQNCNVPIFIA